MGDPEKNHLDQSAVAHEWLKKVLSAKAVPGQSPGTGAVYSLQPNPAHVILNSINAAAAETEKPSEPVGPSAAPGASNKKKLASP